MKTRDDYIRSIYEKRDRYISERRKMRKTALSFCIPITVCMAVGAVFIFGTSRADTAKSLDYAAGSSLNGDIMDENRFAPDEMEQYAFGKKGETGETEVYYNSKLQEGRETAPYSENARDDSAGSDEVLTTTVLSQSVAQETKSASKETHGVAGNDDPQMTISGHTTSAYGTTTVPVTTIPADGDSNIHVKYASVSVSSGMGWTYSSEKDYGSFDKAFIWIVEEGLDRLPDADMPTGEVYTISLSLSDGTSRIFKWSGNRLCDESGVWKAISDSRSEAIKYAVQND